MGPEKAPGSRTNFEQKKNIPSSWFIEVKKGEMPEMGFSDEFRKLGGPDFGRELDEYIFFVYKGHLGYGTRLDRNYSRTINNENNRHRVELLEKRIKQVTGFSAQEIFQELFKLSSEKRKKLQPSTIAREREKKIPMSWFTAIGDKDEAEITLIIFSKEFENLSGPQFKKAVEQYGHFMGNTFVDKKHVKNSSEILDPEIRNIVETAEKTIEQVTGFRAKELWDKRTRLNAAYHGKPQAGPRLKTIWISRNSR